MEQNTTEEKDKAMSFLKGEGYDLVREYNDPPGEVFSKHHHDTDQYLIVMSGSIFISMNGKEEWLYPAGEVSIPAKTEHAVKMGEEGCLYLVGEKTKI